MKKNGIGLMIALVALLICCIFAFYENSTTLRQPLLGEGSEQNPKTDFSNLSLEQLKQLLGEEKGYKEYLQNEKKYEEEMKWLNSEIQKIQDALENNDIVTAGQKKIMLELMVNVYINGIVPHVYMDTSLTGEAKDIMSKVYEGGLKYPNLISGNQGISHYHSGYYSLRIQWIKFKPASRIEAEQKFIRSVLLSVKESEINDVYRTLEKYFTDMVIENPESDILYDDYKCALWVIGPSEELKIYYEISD